MHVVLSHTDDIPLNLIVKSVWDSGPMAGKGKLTSVMRFKPLKNHQIIAAVIVASATLNVVDIAYGADTVVPEGPGVVTPDYRIGPGDTLKVSVFQNEELTSTLPVRPDGKISTPLVEDMVAVGKTPSQLARDVEVALSQYIKSPKVSVEVTIALSVYSQVKVIGQVKTPQSLPYHDGMTVLDAVLAVGGLSQFAAGNRSRLVRQDNGKQTEFDIKLDRLLNKGDTKQNLPLKPGDILVVPETRF